ncbi:MAG: CoA transferase, partial [Pseudomonadota bacterium]
DTPSRIGVSVVDVGTGMHAYEAILEALIARGTAGRGTDIHVSMFEAMTEWMAVPLLHGRYGTAPKRQGLKHPSVAPYGVFACSDGVPVLLSIQNDREWRIFAAELLGDPAVGTDPEFATNVARAKNRRRTDDLVAACFALAPASEIARRLDAADLAYGLLNDVAGVLEHPCLVTTEVTLAERTAEMPARPVRFDGARAPAGRRVPALGAHTDAVRREFVGPSRRRL